ncbi:MAG: 2-oxoacid:acceptor oxidoreductase family protein [archaeon]|nr:2-oxoacid:acceptor oxidoreductase family protein [archaeon]
MSYDIVICGIGGQGVITLGKIIANAALKEGLEVTLMENRGHAKRYDSVSCHVRIGKTYSTVIPKETADLMIALNTEEIMRHEETMKENFTMLIDGQTMKQELSKKHSVQEVNADLTGMHNSGKQRNIFFLGTAGRLEEFPVSQKNLHEALAELLGGTETNLRAFYGSK